MTLPSIIAIGNQKGGVAKTTTCVSLGAVLAEQGERVLMIDLDPQAHLTLSAGLQPDQQHPTIMSAILGEVPLTSVVRTTEVQGVDIAPANELLALMERRVYDQPKYESLLQHSLRVMGSDAYDVILIDCPPAVGTLMLNALTAAELLVIPTQCEYYAVRSLRRLLQLVSLVRQKTNPALAYRVLVTMFDPKNRLSVMIREQLMGWLREGMLKTVIEVDPKLRESAAAGRPITHYAPQTPGAAQYRALAQELMAL